MLQHLQDTGKKEQRFLKKPWWYQSPQCVRKEFVLSWHRRAIEHKKKTTNANSSNSL